MSVREGACEGHTRGWLKDCAMPLGSQDDCESTGLAPSTPHGLKTPFSSVTEQKGPDFQRVLTRENGAIWPYMTIHSSLIQTVLPGQ